MYQEVPNSVRKSQKATKSNRNYHKVSKSDRLDLITKVKYRQTGCRPAYLESEDNGLR